MDYLTAWQNGIPMVRSERETAETIDVYARVSDKQLVELVLTDNETAFEQIFDRYKRLVVSVAARYFRQPEQIEEIVQISFAKAYFELAKFRGAHDLSLASWLGKIATNACLDVIRNQKRKPENLLCELSDAESGALPEIASLGDKNSESRLVERDLAEKLLLRLDAEDRAVLQMLHVEGMNISEIAEVMNWSGSKVKLRAWRARNALRKILKKYL